jgi:hypothetical protein
MTHEEIVEELEEIPMRAIASLLALTSRALVQGTTLQHQYDEWDLEKEVEVGIINFFNDEDLSALIDALSANLMEELISSRKYILNNPAFITAKLDAEYLA